MLSEDQAAELLKRCESIVGKTLKQVRGNLKKAETRASAVWELLVLEEASNIGQMVEYEPITDGKCPDILLTLKNRRKIWIEVAFLHPRFGKEERKTEDVRKWIQEEAKNRNISPYKISFRFDGSKSDVGRKRELPEQHEKKKFLQESEVKDFFESIKDNPTQEFSIKHHKYSIKLIYLPQKEGPFCSYGGLVQENPKKQKEHALSRLLDKKGKQHSGIKEIKLICIGTDQSSVIFDHNYNSLNTENLVDDFLKKTRSISGVIVVKIQNSSLKKIMLRSNNSAKELLSEYEINELKKMNFNRWSYFPPLTQDKNKDIHISKRVTGLLTTGEGINSISLSIPSSIVVDALIGKTNLVKKYFYDYLEDEVDKNDTAYKYLNEGWIIISCSWKKGNIEKREDSKVILELSSPSESILEKDKNNDSNMSKRVTVSLTTGEGINSISLSILSSIVVDALIGKTKLVKEDFYDYLEDEVDKNDTAYKYLNEGWIIISCSWKKGNIEKGEDSEVILKLSSPSESVYGLSN